MRKSGILLCGAGELHQLDHGSLLAMSSGWVPRWSSHMQESRLVFVVVLDAPAR
jgi:hypothetical protein